MLASLPSHTNGVLSVETGIMVPVMVDSVRLLSSLVSVMDGARDDDAEVVREDRDSQ